MPIPTNSGPAGNPAEVPPISDDELVYRRLLRAGWYRNQEHPKIPLKFFMPRPWVTVEKPGDVDGLSVNRASLISEFDASKRSDTGERLPMARFAVAEVYRIGLTVRPAPSLDDLSHAVIPELNSLDQRDSEKATQMEEWALALRNCSVLIKSL